MARLISGAMALPAALTVLHFVPGCSEESPNEPPPNSSAGGTRNRLARPRAGSAVESQTQGDHDQGRKGAAGAAGSAGRRSETGRARRDTIQAKTRDYARLASELGTLEPVRGTKGSWAKLTQAFAESAAELDHAAQAKEKEKTKAALDSLGGSCMGCHRQHRVMGPGMGPPPGGGMGPPPGGFRPPDGGAGAPPGGPPPPANSGGPARQ